MHAGQITALRSNAVLADLARLPRPAAHLQVGDVTDAGQDAAGLAWLDALDAPWFAAVGNHDIAPYIGRTGDAAAAAWGRTRNQSINLGFAQIIILGPPDGNADGVTILLDQATLDYLDAELTANASRPCFIICHAPLYNTVVGTGEFSSASTPWFVVAPVIANQTNGVRDQPIRDILAAHDNAKAWISGHTHNPITNPTLVVPVVCGSHTVAAINASALIYTGTTVEASDPLSSLYMTILTDRIEIRYRDHANGLWTAGPNSALTTVVDLRKALNLTLASLHYVSIPAFNFSLPNPDMMTFEATIKVGSLSSRQTIFTFDDTGAAGALPKFEVGGTATNGKLCVIIPGFFVAQSLNAIAAGTRYKFAYVRSGSGDRHKMFLNGVEIPMETAGVSPTQSYINASAAKAIGRRQASPSQHFGGAIQDVRVWNRPLSAGEILSNLNKALTGNEVGLVGQWRLDEGTGTSALDTTSGAHHGTLQNGAAWGSPF